MARWYDPQIAHFVQPDSIIPAAGSSKGYDWYGYVFYNPIKLSDPSGNSPTGPCGAHGEDCQNNPIPLPPNTDDDGESFPITNTDPIPTISQKGERFIELAENGNRGIYNDDDNPEDANCTIGYGSLLHNGQCSNNFEDETFYGTVNGVYAFYVLDKWGQPWKLQAWGNGVYGLSKHDAELLMKKELAIQGAQIRSKLTVRLTQNQWDALQSFVYQTGQYSTIIGYINEGNNHLAINIEMMSWAGDVVEGGSSPLYDRRLRERRLYFYGDYGAANVP